MEQVSASRQATSNVMIEALECLLEKRRTEREAGIAICERSSERCGKFAREKAVLRTCRRRSMVGGWTSCGRGLVRWVADLRRVRRQTQRLRQASKPGRKTRWRRCTRR